MILTAEGQLCLVTVIYSKAISKEIFTEKLLAAPKQLCNTDEAFQGHVMEFIMEGSHGSVGALSEYFEEYGTEKFSIRIRKTGEAVDIIRDEDGNFILTHRELINDR